MYIIIIIKSYSCVLNFVQSVDKLLGTAGKQTVSTVQHGQNESTDKKSCLNNE